MVVSMCSCTCTRRNCWNSEAHAESQCKSEGHWYRNGFFLSAHSLSARMPPWFCRHMGCPKKQLSLLMTSPSFVLPFLCRLILSPAFQASRTIQVRTRSLILHRNCFMLRIRGENFLDLFFLDHNHHDEVTGKSQKNYSVHMGKFVKCVHTVCASVSCWLNEKGICMCKYLTYSQVHKYLKVEVIILAVWHIILAFN